MTTALPEERTITSFFQPVHGFVGDVIPLLHDGRFHLFYLHEIRDDPESGTSWGLVVTDDFVEYEDLGPVLLSGGPDAVDHNAYTGSVVMADGVAHLFYTGHNPDRLGPDGVTPLQLVMHAVSEDGLMTWTKVPGDTFGAPEGYEPGDWRDPFVFRVPGEPDWRMILAARHDDGPSRRRGVIAQLRSADLSIWRLDEPFWDPRRYITHECPDVFEWNGWWYLVYSEFSDAFTTRYRMSRSPDGPWIVPPHDTVDGRAFYASKSVARDGRRFLVGWIATREGDSDDGAWQWAGTMSVLEAVQAPDGTLGFRIPSEVLAAHDEPVDVRLEHQPVLERPDGYAAVMSEIELPGSFIARFEVDIAAGTRECGILLRASADGDEGYVIRLEPERSRIVFDRWPRRVTGPMQWQISGDVPFVLELERPCPLPPGHHTLDIVVDGTICVVSVDNRVALSARIYDRPAGRLGLFAGEGAATFAHPIVSQRSDPTRKEAR